MIVHLLDGTYELFRQFYGQRRAHKGKDKPMAAVGGLLHDAFLAKRQMNPHIAEGTPIEAMTASGVEGMGVATRIRSLRNRPASTSTTAALIPLPPTSTPMAILPEAISASSSGTRSAPISR
jgi:hypothetical protein